MKRIGIMALALLLLAAFAGCTPTTPTPTITPAATLPMATTTPIVDDADITPPITSPGADGTMTPGVGTSPAVSPGMSPAVSPGTSPAVSPGVAGETAISNFKQGTAVMMTELPLIKNAFEEKYKDATDVKVTHALRESAQVYAIEYKDKDGKTNTVYINPNGTWAS